MRLTTKRNGKNVISLLMAVCGINLPYWRIDRADDLHSYLSGDAADKLAAYEDAEEQGMLFPRWIPVTERLPDDRRDVQITVFWHDAWQTMYGYYDGAYWHLYAPMHTEVADVYVIGWMEKPTPMSPT